MASTINNDGAFSPASTIIVLRANSAGNPIFHNEVDGNFENLRLGHNQVVTELATKSAIGHVHSVVTTSVNGFMSSADKAKLDGVASGANNYALPTASSSTKGGVKVGSNLNISNDVINVPGGTPSTYGVVKYDDSTIKLNGSNQLYAVPVTAAQLGLGSATTDIASLNTLVGSKTNPYSNSAWNSGSNGFERNLWNSISAIEGKLGAEVIPNVSSLSSDISGLQADLNNKASQDSPNFTGTIDIGSALPGPKAQISIGQGTSQALTIIPYYNNGAESQGITLFQSSDIEIDGQLDVGGSVVSGPLTIHSTRTYSSSSSGGGGTGGGSSSSNGLVVNGGAKIDGNLEVTGGITGGIVGQGWKDGGYTTLSGTHKHFGGGGVIWTQNIWSQFPDAQEVFILSHLSESYLYYWDVYEPSWKIAGAVSDNQGGVKGCTIRCSPGTDNNIQYEDQDGRPDIAAGTIKFYANLAPGDENTADVLWIKVISWR